ncbi:MAG TPA: nitric-oxide reductase large subunit [Xanthobacteraceae bacterium]|nr:nitric-oxide reductase large subunit [Xanthobacteraceae bacterium]
MVQYRRLWSLLALIFIGSFAALLWVGGDIFRQKPPIPSEVVSVTGEVLMTAEDIAHGRFVWQSIGGQQLGSIWGHGGYLAPDWSADWLHRELLNMLQYWAAADYGTAYQSLTREQQAALRARLAAEVRNNRVDPQTGRLAVSATRAAAIKANRAYYNGLFGDLTPLDELRKSYAIPHNAIRDVARREALSAFFFWTAWATATNRAGQEVTYTGNWPHEPLIGNTITPASIIWSVASVLMLLLGVGAMVWYQAVFAREQSHPAPPAGDPLGSLRPSPSMRAVTNYFWLVVVLWILQISFGILSAHYAVEGHALYGVPISDVVPYVLSRTWHTQLAVLWIAIAWIATGLYIAPALSGHEPWGQRFGVNLLFGGILVILTGATVGQWLAIQQRLGLEFNFWFGHQGYEYVDLGRFWQLLLFGGLLLWLFLFARAIAPALRRRDDYRTLVFVLFLSSAAIGVFYGASFMWGRTTHLSMVEYWRWWVVHLWVEGFFEVFATAVVALLFAKLGLVRIATATIATLLSTCTFLFGAILGTLHHLYWAGTPTAVLALGAVFSALEVVPLVLVGTEGYQNYRLIKSAKWIETYRWPILFFVAVAFWNMLGAGIFGFLLNPPVSLYYIQGLYTTSVHAHAALFGVYGMLGIGLMLFCLRGLSTRGAWDDRLLRAAFWSLNIGLALMLIMSLLPIGIIQAMASISDGYWAARSAELLQSDLVRALVWLRVPGDTLFAFGGLIMAYFLFKLWRGSRAQANSNAG